MNKDSVDLLLRSGLKFYVSHTSLITRSENFPIDILFVRDDDIPTLLMDGICDLGIVGENVLLEKELYQKNSGCHTGFELAIKLGFGRCRLSIAFPKERAFSDTASLQGLRIATSYPNLLSQYLKKKDIASKVIGFSGSVEITPRLEIADAICDLISTGRTLEEHSLKEVVTLINSQAVLIRSKEKIPEEKEQTISILLRRIKGVIQAQESKYILFHIPKSALNAIKRILPGVETPTTMPLDGYPNKVAVHLVSKEAVFWDTLEELKQVGASSILVLPIEKMMD